MTTAQSNGQKPEVGRIEQHVEFPHIQPEELFEWILDSKVHSAMTKSKATISKEVGSTFSAHNGYLTGKNTEIVPGKKIVQEWRAKGFPEGHNSIATFELSPSKDGTHVHFTHENVPLTSIASLSKGWYTHYWDRMQSYITFKKVWQNSLCHVDIPCNDLKRVAEFYEKTFGWTVTPVMPIYSLFSCKRKSGSSLDGGFTLMTEPITKEKTCMVYIWVDDIEEALKLIKKNGGEVLKEKYPIGKDGAHGFAGEFRDTEGNWMAVWAMPPGMEDPEKTCESSDEPKSKKSKTETIHSVCHADIPTECLARAHRFYETVFNWQFMDMPGYHYFTSGRKTGAVDGGLYQSNKPIYKGQATMLYIYVQDIEKMEPKIEEAGGKIIKKKFSIGENGEHGYTCQFHDSEGNYMALWQQGPQAQEQK